jgi:hypothetical protein
MRAKRSKKTKKKEEKKDNRILEYNGLKAGDKVWAKYLNNQIIQGVIDQFYPKDNIGPAAAILTDAMGFRIVLVSDISKEKIKKSRNKKKRP